MTPLSEVSVTVGLSRRAFLKYGAGTVAGSMVANPTGHAAPLHTRQAFDLEEATIAQLQESMRSGARTSRSICAAYLTRIAELDPKLHAVLETNPDALVVADRLDGERKAGHVRGPLPGIPVLVKDNIATGDRMMTTAGSLALAGVTPPRDAPLVARLRPAGAVILGKTNLSEWANIRSNQSSSGWSARGGQCANPYALDRNPCGSSSGTGAAIGASFAAVGIGTETDRSIVCPSSACSLVGVKPTVGLIDGAGIIPIAHSQDTAGPMARTVAAAALLLGALTRRDVIAFNDANKATEMPYFGQELFLQAQEKGPLSDQAYRDALAKDQRLSRTEGLDVVFAQNNLDAIVAPTGSPAWPTDLVNGDHFLGASSTPAAGAGYPSVAVPVGYAFGLPVGMSFIGRPNSEATLLKLAYAYEQAAKPRKPPRFLATASL